MRTRLAAMLYLLLANIVALFAFLYFGAPAWFPISSLALTLALLWLGRAVSPSKWTLALLLPPLACVIVLNSLLAEAYYLTAAGFSESFFYHVRFDLLFAGLAEHWSLIAFAGAVLAGALVAFGLAIRGAGTSGWPGSAAAAVLAAFLVWEPLLGIAGYLSDAAAYARPQGVVAAMLKPFVHPASAATADPPDSLTRPEAIRLGRPKSLVVLYAESLERSYFDEPAFSELTTELRSIRERSLDFSDIAQVYAAGWTVAGLVATQCGYPLINDPLINLVLARPMPWTEQPILPRAVCLGDILKANGYHVAYVGGADARFAGKESFLSVHGFDEVLGSREIGAYLGLHPGVDPSPAMGAWGYQDDMMLTVAMDRFRSLAEAERPFSLVVLTLDTHHPNGLPSPSCATPGEDSMRQSIRCTDRLLADFVRTIRAGPHSAETMIVVLSDHLAHRTSQTPLMPPDEERRLTFFVNDDDLPARTDAAPGSAFDLPATVIDLLGGGASTIGAGQSLLRGAGFLRRNGLQDQQKQYFLAPPMTARLRSLWGEADAEAPSVPPAAAAPLAERTAPPIEPERITP